MALLKNQTNQDGVTTSYHKINNLSLRDSVLSCQLSSYVSKEYRSLERPADSYAFRFFITVEEEESMGIRQLAYAKIKALEQWMDAEDC